MLEFTDQPYEFFPPRPNRLIIQLAQWLTHTFVLPGPNHRIAELLLEGDGRVHELIEGGARILFLPNHPTHSDPQIMMEVHRRLGIAPSFMAAYDVFLRSKLHAWLIQRTGSFSVDREGSDRKAMATAIDVLKNRRTLTVFPEGNVYFTNDRPTAFLEGAAFIGVRAQKELGADEPIYAVPVAIKATHLVDQREAVLDRMQIAAAMVGSSCDRDADTLPELRRIGQLVLQRHLRAHDYDMPSGDQPISDALEQAAETLIRDLESEIGASPKVADRLVERVRKIRAKIHQIRISPEGKVDGDTARSWADRAILALRMLGYTGNYVADHPTLDRFAETAEKLVEDLRSKAQKPYGKRRATVRLCEPIDLREHSAKRAVAELTDLVEAAVQAAIDDVNAGSSSAGSQLFAGAR